MYRMGLVGLNNQDLASLNCMESDASTARPGNNI